LAECHASAHSDDHILTRRPGNVGWQRVYDAAVHQHRLQAAKADFLVKILAKVAIGNLMKSNY